MIPARALVAAVLLLTSVSALGWIYPEHRQIGVRIVTGLDAERAEAFRRLWEDARAGASSRLCAAGADVDQALAPDCIDWAALSAIAGDHSCSSSDMVDIVLSQAWIMKVAEVAAALGADLQRIPLTGPDAGHTGQESRMEDARRRLAQESHRAERVNMLRTADIRLQQADPEYATRADANLAHFLLARPTTDLDPVGYAKLALQAGSELNAIGVFATLHLDALQKASRLAAEDLTPDERRALARAVLFDEAFALHFLQDAFAAGHVAGSWGNVAERKGTHDFYNQQGLEAFTWGGREQTIVLSGDAHIRPDDVARVARVGRTSLEQVLDAATGRPRSHPVPVVPSAPSHASRFDVCSSVTFPRRPAALRHEGRYDHAMAEVLLATPVPGLSSGLGALPRFQSELGPFIGLSGSLEARHIDRGFAPGQDGSGWLGAADLGLRAGFGFAGAMGQGGDGLVFAQMGFRAESPSSNEASGTILEGLGGSLEAAVPARAGLSTRLRLPYYAVPGDLLLLAPLYLVNADRYAQMAVAAADGGALGWQRGWATRIGRFQLVLGRELGVTWYGLGGESQVAAPSDPPGGPGRAVDYKSVMFDLPILEYRPYRAFGANQSSSLLFQLFAAADVPYDESVASPDDAPPVELRKVYSLGIRLVFDWRYYP